MVDLWRCSLPDKQHDRAYAFGPMSNLAYILASAAAAQVTSSLLLNSNNNNLRSSTSARSRGPNALRELLLLVIMNSTRRYAESCMGQRT